MLALLGSMADNAAYPHDGRADKQRYRHDRRADSQCQTIRVGRETGTTHINHLGLS